MLKLTLKGSITSGWFSPPKGTHSGDKHREVGSGKAVVSKKPVSKHGLGSSPVKSTKDIPVDMRGANDATVVTYEDGSKALFKPGTGMDMGEVGSEVLAYEFSKSVGWDLVPETTATEIGGDVGSLQRWVPGSLDGYKFRDAYGKDKVYEMKRGRDYTRMAVMDRIISNPDRHDGNFVVDKSGRVWAVDNGLAFSPYGTMSVFKRYMDKRIPFKGSLMIDQRYSFAQRSDYSAAYTDVAEWSKTPAYDDYIESVRNLVSPDAVNRVEYAVGVCRDRYGD